MSSVGFVVGNVAYACDTHCMARAIAASRTAGSRRSAIGTTASLDSGCDAMVNGKAVASGGCSTVVVLLRGNAATTESRRAIQVLASLVEVMEGGQFHGELYLEQHGRLQPMISVRLFLSTSIIMSMA